MFPSAALELASSRRRWTPRALATTLTLAVLAVPAAALAQETPPATPPPAAASAPPSIAVDSFAYDVGDTLHLSGQNLEPNATYTVTLTPPAAAAEEPRTLEVTTDESGGLRVDARLSVAGSYSVALTGPRIDARLTVQVEGARQGAGQPGPETPTPEEQEPGAEGPDEAGPGQEAEEPAAEPGEEAAEPGVEHPGAAQAEPQPNAEEPGSQLGSAQDLDIALGDDGLTATVAGDEVWSLRFGPNSGRTAGLLVQD